jgi:hypothetical protein
MVRIRSFQKTSNLKEAEMKSKRDHGTAYNSYGEKLQVKEFWIRKRAQTGYGESLLQRNLCIVNVPK